MSDLKETGLSDERIAQILRYAEEWPTLPGSPSDEFVALASEVAASRARPSSPAPEPPKEATIATGCVAQGNATVRGHGTLPGPNDMVPVSEATVLPELPKGWRLDPRSGDTLPMTDVKWYQAERFDDDGVSVGWVTLFDDGETLEFHSSGYFTEAVVSFLAARASQVEGRTGNG